MKKCTNCKQEKKSAEFNVDKSTKDGRTCWCRLCWKSFNKTYRFKNRDKMNKNRKEWGINNRPKVNANVRKYRTKHIAYDKQRKESYWLKWKYGITVDQKSKMIFDQNGRCGCCGELFENEAKKIAVDHCHDTGTIRKILCNKCNFAIGLIDESVEKAQKILEYIKYCTDIKTKRSAYMQTVLK